MSDRLAFQTQLASIMEVLANAAVAEICKLVDDDYAVVRLQMSQCQRENKALKRKLHLLELKMARGNAERRLRESALNSSRPRVQINGSDRLREPSTPAGDVFDQQGEVLLWPSGDAAGQLILSESVHSKSPDVELVEPEAVLVKEEKVPAATPRDEEAEQSASLIGDDGPQAPLSGVSPVRKAGRQKASCSDGSSRQQLSETLEKRCCASFYISEGLMECVPHAAEAQMPGPEDQDAQSTRCQSQSQACRTKLPGSRGVEVSGSSPLKCQLTASVEGRDSLQEAAIPHRYIDDGGSDSKFDVLCDIDKTGRSLVGEFFDEPSNVDVEGTSPSCSYSMAAVDLPSTSSGVNGWSRYDNVFSLPRPFSDSSKAFPRTGRERLFACSYCGKAFNRPKKVEIHQRVHTGEKPFSCSTCGKMFSEAGNLRKHQRVHTGEKPYTCGVCGRGFAWIRNLKTHQQKSHADIYNEQTWECK